MRSFRLHLRWPRPQVILARVSINRRSMIYFSVALPGRLADWCDTAIAWLAAQDGRTVERLTFADAVDGKVSILDEIALALVRSNADHVVVGIRRLNAGLMDTLRETGVPFVLGLADPRAAVADIAGGEGGTFLHITREMANMAPLVMRTMRMPGGLAIRPADIVTRGADTLARIARHLGISLDEVQAHAIAARLDPDADRNWEARIPPEMHKLVNGALGGYAAHFSGGELGDLVWQRDLFLAGDNDVRSPSGPIALRDTANGRFLVYGPYLALPPGYWSAKVVMGISPEAVGQTFTVDAFSGRHLAVTKILARAEGIFTAEIGFEVDEEASRNIEIRVSIGRDVAPGYLAFGHVRLHPVAIRHEDSVIAVEGDFRAVLSL